MTVAANTSFRSRDVTRLVDADGRRGATIQAMPMLMTYSPIIGAANTV